MSCFKLNSFLTLRHSRVQCQLNRWISLYSVFSALGAIIYIYIIAVYNCAHDALPVLRSLPRQLDLYHAKNVLAPGIICAYSTANTFFFSH